MNMRPPAGNEQNPAAFGPPRGAGAPQQWGPPPTSKKQASKRRFLWLKILLGGAVGLILLGVLTMMFMAYSFKRSLIHDNPDVPLSFDFNTWMADGYGQGLGKPWETRGDVIGTSADRSKVLTSEPIELRSLGDPRRNVDNTITRIHDVATGEVLHEFHKTYDCHQSLPSIEGKIYCTKLPESGMELHGTDQFEHELGWFDVATGEFTTLAKTPFLVSGLRVFGEDDGKVFAGVETETQDVLAVFNADGSLAWTAQGIGFEEARGCRIAGDAIACEHDFRVVALKIADGSTIVDEVSDGAMSVAWSDQAVAMGERFGDERDLWMFDGTRATTENLPNVVSTPGNTVAEPVLPHDVMDQEKLIGHIGIDGKTYAVSQPGAPFMESGIHLLATETFIPRETPGPLILSEHGEAFIMDYVLTDTMSVLNAEGQEVGELPEGATLVDGLFHVPGREWQSNTVVVPPAG